MSDSLPVGRLAIVLGVEEDECFKLRAWWGTERVEADRLSGDAIFLGGLDETGPDELAKEGGEVGS